MNNDTLKALKDSIKHWEQNYRRRLPKNVVVGPGACALCVLFTNEYTTIRACGSCPVGNKTGVTLCINTPYAEAAQAHSVWSKQPDSFVAKFDWLQVCLEEIDFLKSLLPEGES